MSYQISKLSLLVAGWLVVTGRSEAQVAQTAAARCDYAACSLSIAPRLSGLDVVRGGDERPVASLGFLRAGDVRPAFAGSDAAVAHAVRAMRLRRAGAFLTTLGVAGAVVGAVRGASHDRAGSIGFAAAGVSLFAVSVPVHFAADAELSRAVWEYNRRFTGDTVRP